MKYVHKLRVTGHDHYGGVINNTHQICIWCFDQFLGHVVINGFTVKQLEVVPEECDSCEKDTDPYYGSGQ